MKKSLVKLLFSTILLSLAGCLADEPGDVTKKITMSVSEETGITYHWCDDRREHPIECMLVKERGESEWSSLCYGLIEGFEYEKGHAYELRVKKTILANPPADDSNCRYSLISIVKDTPIK